MPLRSYFRTKDASEVADDPAQDGDGRSNRSTRSTFISTLRRTVERFSTSGRSSRASTPVPDFPANDRPFPDPSQAPAPAEPASPTAQAARRSHTSTRTSVRRQKTSDKPGETKADEQAITGPLSDEELGRLFCGAPEFSLAPNGDGELEPRVTYPHGLPQDVEEATLKDYRPPGHPAYELTTVRDQGELIAETPSMKSAFGLEPGTSGWEYYLMLPIGDSERPIDEPSEDMDENARERGAPGDPKGGVRSVEVGYLAERLKELGSIWHTRKKKRGRSHGTPDEDEEKATEPTTVELYSHLFSRILFPPTRVTTEDYLDPYSLRVQILSLTSCLSKKMWLDFGNVSWRIKLGQILWGDASVEEEFDENSMSSNETEKVWLLLQLLLASELLLRLDSVLNDGAALTTAPNSASMDPSEQQAALLAQIRETGGSKVLWDLVLARRWLENIKIIEPDTQSPEAAPTPPPTSRWFGTISPATTSSSSPSTPASSPGDVSKITDALLVPRHANRQIDGLLQFSRRLQWPNIDRLAQQMLSKRTPINLPAASIYNGSSNSTPISTITSAGANSYFPERPRHAPPTLHHKRSILAIPTAESSGGWLSRSYLTGLLLPGEGLPHLLMSTLLENDVAAVEALGFNANLYGGFQYNGSTWWSRHCILSRILAGYVGAVEECGWVGPAIPSGVGAMGRIADGWVDVVVEPPPEDTARALNPDAVFRESRISPLERNGPANHSYRFLPAPPSQQKVSIEVRGVHFSPLPPLQSLDSDTTTEQDPTNDEFPRYHTAVHFLVGMEQKVVDVNYDVAFVSAWPCVGTHRLWSGYKARWVSVGELVGSTVETRPGLENKRRNSVVDGFWSVVNGGGGGNAATSPPPTAVEEKDEVKLIRVLTPEMRVLAMAWCAQTGMDAVVARRGKTCHACAVREARALGVRVVVVVG